MTTTSSNPHPFREFSDILSFYESPITGIRTNSPTTKNNSRRCLYCQREIVDKNNLSPYCNSTCMESKDKGIKIDHKGSEKNAMLKFSDIFTQ